MPINIRPEPLDGPEIADLLLAHGRLMLEWSPAESCHFLPIEGLRQPNVEVWSIWEDDALLGCGALKTLDEKTGEIKSMHTVQTQRGRGLGRMMLAHILDKARERGMIQLYLETGSQEGFAPARTLYADHGFIECGPFGDYVLDPHSIFMTLKLD